MMMRPEKLGPYRLERLLGRGGMGAVYAGLNEETGERAAIKVLAPAFAAEANFRGRFSAEIETLKKLRHPNIVQLYGFGEEEGSLFYAMQLIEGDNLELEVKKGRNFDWREVITIGLDVCKALKHAHDRGVIHRDLKPANLLRGDDGRILLSDFGIAKLFGGAEFTAAGGVIGTADYMSPEQAAGEGVAPRSDLYSLGASIFYLLAGRPPFQGRSVPDIIHQVRFSEAPLVSRFAPTTPVELEAIIARLLEKDPKKRIPTAIALTNLLASMANIAPQTVLDTSPPALEPEDEAAFVLSSEMTKPGAAPFDAAVTDKPTAVVAESEAPRLDTGDAETLVTAPNGDAFAPAQDAAPSAAPTSRFITVPEEELGRLDVAEAEDEEGSFGWFKLAAGIAVLAAFLMLAWRATRPPSADQLAAEIERLMDASDSTAAAAGIDDFLARFPDDPRRAAIEGYRQGLEVARLERLMERKARGSRVGEAMPLIETTYLRAMQTAQSDPARAIEELTSLIDVFGTQPETSGADSVCLELARKQLERLEQTMREAAGEHRTALARRLETAEALRESDPAAARSIWQGIVDLYRNYPWAAEAVAEAQKNLDAG
jgi:eukaryotic-like serine/threonine-protein kinase